MNWNRKLWGIEMTGKDGRKSLLGSLWYHEFTHLRKYYDQEPTRALVFCTRKAAREWCKAERAKYVERNDSCAFWRFHAVRVRETVKAI